MAETLADTDWSEHYIKRGNPKKSTYYIIRQRTESLGLFYRFELVAGHIRHALSNGWLPVVDMQNYPNAYLPPEKLGKENSWEYYFEQPLRIGLEQAYSGDNVILSAISPACGQPSSAMSFYTNQNDILTEWRMLTKLGLLKIKPALMAEISALREKLFGSKNRILGVHLRGTDYVANKPKNHPIPPPIEFAVSTIIEKMETWQCNKLFLATEDKKIIEVVRSIFGDLCITLNQEYVDYKPGEVVSFMRINRENDHFLQGKDYLTEMVLLSMCNSFIAARCAGTVGVMLMADKFEHTYFFNLGRYGIIGFD